MPLEERAIGLSARPIASQITASRLNLTETACVMNGDGSAMPVQMVIDLSMATVTEDEALSRARPHSPDNPG